MASPPRYSVDSSSPISPSPSRPEYPFPRLGSNSRFPPGRLSRRGSTASSIHSVGGSLDTASHWDGITESGQNAISTLLQPPIVRTGLLPHTTAPASSTHKAPTARDIPPVTLSNIPSVDPANFKSYLTQVGALYEALQRAKDNEEEGGTQLFRKKDKPDDFSDLFDPERRSHRPGLIKQSSLVSLASTLDSPSPRRARSSSATGKRVAPVATPLSTIPNVYFEEDFHLENPRTFDVVSERSDVIRPVPGSPDERKGANGFAGTPRKALATNAILQEKLSWYMDTIEVHLIASISSASTSFFAALGSLKDLHSEAAESVDRIKDLRKELDQLDQEMALGGLEVVKKRRRMENLNQLSDSIQQLRQVVEVMKKCDQLVEKGEVEAALDGIDALENLIAGEEQALPDSTIQLRDLRAATALQGIPDDLDTLRSRIGRAFEGKFLNALLTDLRQYVERISIADTLQRWSSSSQRSRGGHNREASVYPSYLVMSEEFRAEVLSIQKGLYRAGYTSPSTSAYRDSVLRESRNIIRRALPASNDDDADSVMSSSTVGGNRQRSSQDKSMALARNLRALDSEDSEELLKSIYVGIGETLRRASSQAKVLLDVTNTISDPTSGVRSPISPITTNLEDRIKGDSMEAAVRAIQEDMHKTLDMSNLLGQAVDVAQERIVKILKVRSAQTNQLPVERFLRYFTVNLLFANECEAVSGRSGTSLKNTVNAQIKDYVQQMAEHERQSLATGMQADPWNVKDFSEEDTKHLTRILAASTRDPDEWATAKKIWLPASDSPSNLPLSKPSNGNLSVTEPHTNGSADSGRSTPTPSSKNAKPATIDSELFHIPESAILCLHGLSSFLHFITGLPSMTSEVATNIISYLNLFNDRIRQLILGAGATKTAGLKNITTKHLVVAAQALSFVATLIPHIREFVRRHAGSAASSIMGEFDKVRRLYLEHQQSIYDKLLDIMSSRASAHAKAIRSINWEEGELDQVHGYVETLVKETNTLYKVLSKHLPTATAKVVMDPIYKAYKEQLGQAYGDVAIASENAQARMLCDAEYFKTKLSTLDTTGDTGEHVVSIVKAKTIGRPAPPA